MPIKLTYSSPNDPVLRKLLIRIIEQMSGQPRLEKKYQQILDQDPLPLDVWKMMVESLELSLSYRHEQLLKVPTHEPVVFITNHPYGVVDGIVLGYLVSLINPRFKFLVNEVLCRDEKLNQFFLPIDFAPTKAAQQTNIRTRKKAISQLARDEPIVIFPSGGVATSPKLWKKAEELEWKRFVVKLIKVAKATVVPIFFYGQNSFLFQLASHISEPLRLALLLNEVRNKIGKELKITIGDPIGYEVMEPQKPEEALSFLYQSVMQLAVPSEKTYQGTPAVKMTTSADDLLKTDDS